MNEAHDPRAVAEARAKSSGPDSPEALADQELGDGLPAQQPAHVVDPGLIMGPVGQAPASDIEATPPRSAAAREQVKLED